MQAAFPDVWNADTWNLDLVPGNLIRQYNIGISETFRTPSQSPKIATYVQDDWQMTDRLTVNLGLRYDLIKKGWASETELLPFLESGRPDDSDNVQPRLWFAYSLNDRTVLRGGAGLYYGDILGNLQMWTMGNETIATITIPYDGRADFATSPFNGPAPSIAEAFARFCDVNGGQPGCLFRGPNELSPPPAYAEVQNSWQTSIGFAPVDRRDGVRGLTTPTRAAATRRACRATST